MTLPQPMWGKKQHATSLKRCWSELKVLLGLVNFVLTCSGILLLLVSSISHVLVSTNIYVHESIYWDVMYFKLQVCTWCLFPGYLCTFDYLDWWNYRAVLKLNQNKRKKPNYLTWFATSIGSRSQRTSFISEDHLAVRIPVTITSSDNIQVSIRNR